MNKPAMRSPANPIWKGAHFMNYSPYSTARCDTCNLFFNWKKDEVIKHKACPHCGVKFGVPLV